MLLKFNPEHILGTKRIWRLATIGVPIGTLNSINGISDAGFWDIT